LLSPLKIEKSPIAAAITAKSTTRFLMLDISFSSQNGSLNAMLVKYLLFAYSYDNLSSSINPDD
jgi:hypothetical protein